MIRVMGLKVNLHRMHPFRSTNDPMGRMITVLKGGHFTQASTGESLPQ